MFYEVRVFVLIMLEKLTVNMDMNCVRITSIIMGLAEYVKLVSMIIIN